MRVAIVVLSLAYFCLAQKLVQLDIDNKRYTVAQTCLNRVVDFCASSKDEKALKSFTESAKQIEQINAGTSSWSAQHNKFSTIPLDEIKQRATAVKQKRTAKSAKSKRTNRKLLSALPQDFDARKKWPKCISPVRTQGKCGSCWAWGSSQVLADRMCIATKGKAVIPLSVQDAISCGNIIGCVGGSSAWQFYSYANDTGVLAESCNSYKSENFVKPGPDLACPALCDDGKTGLDKSTRYHSTRGKAISGIDEIKQEIMTYGPVTASLKVNLDLMFYGSGIYHSVLTGKPMGGHVVSIVGWGLDPAKKQEYWIVRNSWGTSWGMSGYFNILMGDSEIDDEVIAADFTVTSKNKARSPQVGPRPEVTLPPEAFQGGINKGRQPPVAAQVKPSVWTTLPPLYSASRNSYGATPGYTNSPSQQKYFEQLAARAAAKNKK